MKTQEDSGDCSALLAPGHVQGQGGADGGRGDSSVCWSLGPL